MKIKPVEGRLVRDPATMLPLPAEGTEVPDFDPHWREALRWGDVVMIEGPGAPSGTQPADPLAASIAHAEQSFHSPGPIERAEDPAPLTETPHVG